MVNEELIKKCEEYVHLFWCMEDLKDGGIFAVYGLEQHRIELHNEICDMLGIDHERSKTILSFLDKSIGLNLSEQPSDAELSEYGIKLADLLTEKQSELKD